MDSCWAPLGADMGPTHVQEKIRTQSTHCPIASDHDSIQSHADDPILSNGEKKSMCRDKQLQQALSWVLSGSPPGAADESPVFSNLSEITRRRKGSKISNARPSRHAQHGKVLEGDGEKERWG